MTVLEKEAPMFDITDEAYLAKRAIDDFDSIENYTPKEDRRFTLTRDDGAELSYQFTDERMGDAFTIIVAAEDKIPEGVAGKLSLTNYCQVLDTEDIEEKVYRAIIASWAKKEPLS